MSAFPRRELNGGVGWIVCRGNTPRAGAVVQRRSCPVCPHRQMCPQLPPLHPPRCYLGHRRQTRCRCLVPHPLPLPLRARYAAAVGDPVLTEDNLESSMISGLRVFNRHIDLAEGADPYAVLLAKKAKGH